MPRARVARPEPKYGVKNFSNDYGKWVIDFAADTNHICVKPHLVYRHTDRRIWALDLPVWVPNPEQPEQLYAAVQDVLTLKDVRETQEPHGGFSIISDQVLRANGYTRHKVPIAESDRHLGDREYYWQWKDAEGKVVLQAANRYNVGKFGPDAWVARVLTKADLQGSLFHELP